MEEKSSFAAALLVIFGLVLITRPEADQTRGNAPPAPPAAQAGQADTDGAQAAEPSGARETSGNASAEPRRRKPGRQTPIEPTPPRPSLAWQEQCGGVLPVLKPICTEFDDPDDKPPAKNAYWSQAPWVARARGHVRCVMAMVGDPDATGDTLGFDRAVEMIQTAASAAPLEYRMHRYWIPWQPRTGANAEPTISDQPGMLLFRSPPGDPFDFLAVFLVGESPVYGVEKLQFLNTVEYMRDLSGRLNTVFVAGPNFSGSFQSLRSAVDKSVKSGREAEFRFISPSATVENAGKEFRRTKDTPNRAPAGHDASRMRGPIIEYNSIIHNDSYARRHFRKYVKGRWGFGLEQQVMLAESVTTFGQSTKEAQPTAANPKSVPPIQFPRGIFRLRNVYPEASATTLFETSATPGQSDGVAFTVKGRRGGLDSVPSLAYDQVPVVQESELLAIASLMRESEAKLAEVVATDPYDWIFVAGFLHKVYAEARFWNANADLLIPRAVQQYPLEGSLAVTTFPLVMRNQIWCPGPTEMSVLAASSRYEIGLFNAFRAVLLEKAEEPLLEYSFPGHTRQDAPPLWLTVAGTNGYWPIALLDRGAKEPDGLQLPLNPGPASNGDPDNWPDPGYPADPWLAAFAVILAAALMLGAAILLAQWNHPQNRLNLTGLAARPADSGVAARAYFAAAAALVLCSMVLIIAGPVWMLAWNRPGVQPAWPVKFSAGSVLAFAVSLAAAVTPQLVYVVRKPRLPSEGYAGASAVIFVAFAVFGAVWMPAIASGSNYEGFFLTYRSLDLLSGVSPVLPFLLVGAGLALLVILNQRRDALDRQRPEVPALGEGASGEDPAALAGRVAEPLRNPLLSRQPLAWAIAAGGLVTLLSLLAADGQQSLESGKYDRLFKATFLGLCVVVVFAWGRFLIVSIRLRQMLDRLASHPLRMAFAALAPGYSASLLRGGGRRGISDLLPDSINVLRAAMHSTAAGSERDPMAEHLSNIETEAVEYRNSRTPVTALANVHRALKNAGEHLVVSLRPVWQEGTSAASLRDEQAGESRTRACPEPLRPRQEFVAIQYAAFIGNVSNQLRSMLAFMTAGFFLGMFATMVYPFRSSLRLAWAGTINFILLGIPVLICIVWIEKHPLIRELNSRQKGIQFVATARLAIYALLPIAAIVTAHFPGLRRHLVSLLEPAAKALR